MKKVRTIRYKKNECGPMNCVVSRWEWFGYVISGALAGAIVVYAVYKLSGM